MNHQGPFTIVTGATSNHFKCLLNLLSSIDVFEPYAKVVVYNLGLTLSEVQQLSAKRIECRKFEFDFYPAYVNIRVNRGEYAWKPIIVADALREFGGMVLWLDAGDLIHAPLHKGRDVLSAQGIYTPQSPGTLRQWTHPQTLERLKVSAALLNKRNRNGAIVGFASFKPGMTEMANRWKQCALDKDCIAPPGSSRENHRQDQAVLTVLAYQFQLRYGFALENARLDISIHNDDCVSPE
jgi:hypothetical protein